MEFNATIPNPRNVHSSPCVKSGSGRDPKSWGKKEDLVNLGIGKGQKRGRAVPSNSSCCGGLVVLPGLVSRLSASLFLCTSPIGDLSLPFPSIILSRYWARNVTTSSFSVWQFLLPLILSCVAERHHPSLPAQHTAIEPDPRLRSWTSNTVTSTTQTSPGGGDGMQ